MANLVNEAALLASRRDHAAVKRSDFEDAKDKVMLGAERRSMIMTKEDRRLSAYHEAGHALVAKLAPGAHQIGKATIIPRGQAMGMVSFLPDERRSVTETRLRLTWLLPWKGAAPSASYLTNALRVLRATTSRWPHWRARWYVSGG